MKRNSGLYTDTQGPSFLPSKGNVIRIAGLVAVLLLFFINLGFSQTAGMVIKPAIGGGASVLDPDGDGYVSQKTNGVQLGFTSPPNNDVSQSEIPYVDMQKIDPVADLLRGPTGSFSEIIGVDAAGSNAILWYSDGTNLLYRFRIDNFAPNSKSYSVLLDTDSKFGFTGIGADPNALTGNPGFEVEIVLETNFNVKVYNVDGTTSGVLVASYSYDTNCQKSIARTVTSGDADYFYDFYVAYPTSLFTASTPLRCVTLTCMNPQPAIGNNAQSDVGGSGGTGSLDQTFSDVIGTQTPSLPGTTVLDRSACPTINAVGTTSTTISGTSTEASGTTITVKVYQSDGVTLLGSATTTTSGTTWSINVSALSPSVTLASGQLVKATATAAGKGISADNCSTKTVTGCAGTTSTTGVVLTKISGGKGYTVANTFPAGTIVTWYNADYSIAVYPIKSGSTTNIVNPQTTTTASQTLTFSTSTGQTFPNDVFYFTFQVPGQCVSNYLSDCQFSPSGTSVAPVITTSTITPYTTSISGTCSNTADTHISLFANGVLLRSLTVIGSTTWTISGLNLTSYDCATITASAADVGKCPTVSAGVAVSHAGLKPSINTSGCSPTSPVTSITGFSNDTDGTIITLYDTNPTRAAIGTGTVTSGAWTITPSPSLVSGDIIVAAATSGGCISVGPDSDPVTIATQTSLGGYTINITAPTEGASAVGGTISGGSYPVTLKVYVDQTLVGSGISVGTAGSWSVGSLLSTDLYIGATINVTLTAASSCESVLSTASATVQCLQPNAPTYTGGSFHYCLGGAGQLTVTGTEALVIYQLVDGSGNAQGPATVGNGGTITLRTNVLNSNLGPVYVKAFKLASPSCYVIGSAAINFDQVDPTPSITFSSTSVSVMRGTTTVNLPYSAISSTPAANTYTIEYSVLAKNQGFLNVSSTTIPSSPIVLAVPANPALGSYNGTLTVANSSGATCTSSYGFTVTVYASDSPPVISSQPSSATICSGSTTVLTVTAVNATGYQWQSSSTFGGTFANVTGGSGANTASYTTTALTSKTYYRVVVSNANPGASGSVISNIVPVFVTALPSAAGTITGSDNVCQGSSSSYSIADVTGATSYTWSYSGSNVTISGGTTTTASLSFASNATSGTLSVTANNSCGSGTAATLPITVGAKPYINNMTANACNSAAFTVTPTDVTNGVVPSGTTYSWSTPVVTGSITGGSSGSGASITGNLTNPQSSTQTAIYTVTPVKGTCTGATFTVTVSVNPTINITPTPVNALCNGASTGSITLVVTGGTPTYTYDWGSGITTQNRSAIPAGTYSVTVTDSKSCSATASSITVGQASAITITPTVTNVLCSGAATGAISLAASGGAGSYAYLWNDGSALQNRTGLIAGTYSVTVTDASGCAQASGSISVTENSTISASAGASTISCYGGSSTITVTASGGNGTLTYSLNGGTYQAGNTFSVTASASPYLITVKDASNCTKNCSVTVSEPTALALNGTVVNAACNGGSTGSIDVTASGGTAPYTYKIGAGAYDTPHLFGSLAAGSYTVTAKDANGCEKASSFTVTQPSAALSATPTVTNVSCNGGSSGQISLAVSGGTAPYTYSWTGPSSYTATTQNINGLAAGTYSVTVTDSKSCTYSPSASVVTQPSSLTPTITSSTNVSCKGGSNGAINLTVSGGTTSYTYSWSNGATTEDISSLTGGTYTVTVTDSKGCTATNAATITEPAAVLSGSASGSTINCNGAATGSVNLTVTGGTTSYSYLWSNSATTEDLSGVVAGNYSVTITDNKGCTATASATVTQLNPITVSSSVIQPTCPPDATLLNSDGSINLTVSGGTAGYTYSWSGGNIVATGQVTAEDPVGLQAAVYSVTVTDSNSCQKTSSVTLTYQNPKPVVPGTITKN